MARRARSANLLAGLGALVVLTSAPHARADARDESREEFKRGVALVKEGQLVEARDAFEHAYAIFPHPSILLNLGIVRLRTGEYVKAEDDLARFLVNDGGALPDEIASARAALAETRGHLGTIRIKVSPAYVRVTVDDKPVAVDQGGTTDIRTTTGLHDVRISADDYDSDEEHVMVTANKTAERTVMLTPHAAGGTGDASGSGGTPSHGISKQAIVGWGLVGLGGLTAIGGIFCGIRAISLANDYNDERPQNPSDRSTGIAFRTTADVLFATAIVSGGIGAYLVLTAPKSSTTVAVGPGEVRFKLAF